MKRKSRKSGSNNDNQNGVDKKDTQNGDSIDTDEPEIKKKANKRRSVPLTDKKELQTTTDDEPQYEVEKILEEKKIKGVRHYLIRWKGYEPESDSWEPVGTLNCAELIADFKAKQKKQGRKQPRTKNGSPQNETWDENEHFEVDRILEVHFRKNGSREFLVSWKGYPMSQNTWEPEENMDCPELIGKFMAKVEKAKESDQRELRVKRAHTDRFTLSMASHGRRLSKRNQGKQRIHYHDAE